MPDDLSAWLLVLFTGATGSVLVAWGLGWLGPSAQGDPDTPHRRRAGPRRKLRLAGAVLALMTGLSFGPTNCVRQPAAGLASRRPAVRTWSQPASPGGGPCRTRPCP